MRPSLWKTERRFCNYIQREAEWGFVLSKMQFRHFSRGSLVGQKQAYKPSPKTPQLLWGCSKITEHRMSLANPRGSPGISVIPESPKNIAKCIFKSAFLSTFGFLSDFGGISGGSSNGSLRWQSPMAVGLAAVAAAPPPQAPAPGSSKPHRTT